MGRSMGRWVTLHGSTILSEDETPTHFGKKCEVRERDDCGISRVMNVRKITCNVFEITRVLDCIGIIFQRLGYFWFCFLSFLSKGVTE